MKQDHSHNVIKFPDSDYEKSKRKRSKKIKNVDGVKYFTEKHTKFDCQALVSIQRGSWAIEWHQH